MLTQMNIRLDTSFRTRIKMFCAERETLMEDMVKTAIEKYMDDIEKSELIKNNK